ncbi:MAG: hypothetical protein P4N59_29685 [Negativicutes bacterium]|nr:hypothetical protein [Negativicutes bacterium]
MAGGWLGVAVAIGYATYKLIEYATQQNGVQSKRYAAHGQEPQYDENGFVIPIYGPSENEGVGGLKGATDRASDEDIAKAKAAALKTQTSSDLADQMAAIMAAGQKTPTHAVHDHAAAIQRANQQAAQLMADLNKKVASSSSNVYETGMANIADEVQRMNKEVADITKNGGDASVLSDKIAQYQQVAAAKVTDNWRQAWQDVKDQASLVNAQLLHDKGAEADAEYQIALTRIAKEQKAELDAIAQSGNDKEAINQANADAAAKRKAAAQKHDYTKGDNTLKADQQALESAQLQVTIAGKTQAQVDAIKQRGLATYIADLNAEYAAAGTDADRKLSIQRQLADAITQQNQIAATNVHTAWDVAFKEIANQQTNYSDIIVGAWNNIRNDIGSTFDKIVDQGMSATDALRNIFQSVVQDIEKMFLKMWEEQYIMGPLQQLLGSMGLGGATGGGGGGGTPAGLTSIPAPSEAYGLGFAAQGGGVSGWTVVGEQGPELAYFGDSARVYNAGESTAMASSAGASASPNINVNVVNRSGQQLSVTQQAQYDPATHTTLMQMFVDGVNKNLAGSRDLLFGRG